MIVDPSRLASETLDHLDSMAEMLCECWPNIAHDDDIRQAVDALIDVITALCRGDRGAALLAAEIIRRRQLARFEPRLDLAWRATPFPEHDGAA